MNILYITNVYPNEKRNFSPIVKNIYTKYKSTYKEDNLYLKVIDKSNFINVLMEIRKYIYKHNIDIVHVHFGGLYALIISLFIPNSCKSIITFHGTDIHAKVPEESNIIKYVKIKINKIASLVSILFYNNIDLVSEYLRKFIPLYILNLKKIIVSPLGVNYQLFKPIDKEESKKILKLNINMKYVLFVSSENSKIKREDYARVIVALLGAPYQLLKLNNIKYEDVPLYINSSEFILITSKDEGSPNIVREALACNIPVVSVDVGDISKYLEKTKNSFLINKYNEQEAIKIIKLNINKFEEREDTRKLFQNDISLSNTTKKLNILYKQLKDIYE